MPSEEHPRAVHVAAILTALATFPLIFMGGLVTSHGAGLAVPDWPNSFGYNMFTFPPSKWVGGIWYEHVHRLKGTVVGILAVTLVLLAYAPSRNPLTRKILGRSALLFLSTGAVALTGRVIGASSGWLEYEQAKRVDHAVVALLGATFVAAVAWLARRPEPRRWVRRLTLAVLLAVIAQGLMGGLRVTEVNLDLAIVHACFGQAFFALAVVTAIVTGRRWIDAPEARPIAPETTSPPARGLLALGILAILAIYLQLIAGATMRHYQAGLAIPDLPLAYGRLLPPTSPADMAALNLERAERHQLPPVALWQVWLHFAHRIGAVVVTVLVAWYALARRRGAPGPWWSSPRALLALLSAQFALGVLTVLWKKPADIASSHVAVGALLLATTVASVVHLARATARRPAATPSRHPLAAPGVAQPA